MMFSDEERCTSMRRTHLHREAPGDLEVYMRCTKSADHPGKQHKCRIFKWSDDHEDGFLETDPNLVSLDGKLYDRLEELVDSGALETDSIVDFVNVALEDAIMEALP